MQDIVPQITGERDPEIQTSFTPILTKIKSLKLNKVFIVDILFKKNKYLRDAVQKKNVIFSDIVTIAFDPHPP